MLTRFFVVNPDEAEGFKSLLMPDGDTLPLSELQSKIVATLTDGRNIIHAIIPDYVLTTLSESIDKDPMTLEGVIELGITQRYAGKDRAEVLVNFPELNGQVKIGEDEEGNSILVDKLMNHKWLGEE